MKRVPLMLCAAIAATTTFALTDTAIAEYRGGCHHWHQAYLDAKKRGDYATASQAKDHWRACIDNFTEHRAGLPGSHKQLHPRRGVNAVDLIFRFGTGGRRHGGGHQGHHGDDD